MSEFDLKQFISARAGARAIEHFRLIDLPDYVKPHPKPISLGGGTPNDGFFPVDSISISIVDQPFQHLKLKENASSSVESLPNTTATEEVKVESVNVPRYASTEKEIDLKYGLQYSAVGGLTPLRTFTKDFITEVHKPGYEEWNTLLDTGAGNGIDKVCDLLLNKDDVILIEEYTFTPILMNVRDKGGIPLPVKLNFRGDGIDVEYLAHLLDNWESIYPENKKPKALYTIATGQNPTGLTQSLESRKKIYALAEKHNFIIIEDDPYGYISIPPYKKGAEIEDLSTEEYKKTLTPSYLTIDTKGRVLRIETFSKLFAPGLRLGFMVGHKDFIQVMENYSVIATRSPSGPSQFIANNVIQHWGGVQGWINWIKKIRKAYIHRRDVLLGVLLESEAYEKKLIEPIDPSAGMFISVHINLPAKYTADPKDIAPTLKGLTYKFIENGVICVPGPNMAFHPVAAEHGSFYRLTIAASTDDAELEEAGKRFVKSVVEFFDELK